MFNSKVVDITDKMKEGWLEKESRFRKVFRSRWCVLTVKTLYTFKMEKMYVDPTEQIDTTSIKTVRTDEKSSNVFVSRYLIIKYISQRLELGDGSVFIFQAKNFEEKESWIGAIGKAMIKSTTSGDMP